MFVNSEIAPELTVASPGSTRNVHQLKTELYTSAAFGYSPDCLPLTVASPGSRNVHQNFFYTSAALGYSPDLSMRTFPVNPRPGDNLVRRLYKQGKQHPKQQAPHFSQLTTAAWRESAHAAVGQRARLKLWKTPELIAGTRCNLQHWDGTRFLSLFFFFLFGGTTALDFSQSMHGTMEVGRVDMHACSRSKPQDFS